MICSIFKTVELKNITGTMDPTWSGVNLSIWSGTELSVGIFIASLPPLRKVFDGLLRKYMPGMSTSGPKSTPLYDTPGQAYGNRSTHGTDIRLNTMGRGDRSTRKSYHPGESVLDSDSESEKAILDEENKIQGMGITKTTRVVVSSDELRSSGQNSPTGSISMVDARQMR